MEADDGGVKPACNGAPPRGGGSLYVLELPKIPEDSHIYLKVGQTWQPTQARLTKLKSEIPADKKHSFAKDAPDGWWFRRTALALVLSDVKLAEQVLKDLNAKRTVPDLFVPGFRYVNEIFAFENEKEIKLWLRSVDEIVAKCIDFGDVVREALAKAPYDDATDIADHPQYSNITYFIEAGARQGMWRCAFCDSYHARNIHEDKWLRGQDMRKPKRQRQAVKQPADQEAMHMTEAAHQEALQKTKAEHQETMQKTKAEHQETMQKTKAEHQETMQKTKAEHQETMQKTKAEHQETMRKTKAEHQETMRRADAEHKEALSKTYAEHKEATQKLQVEMQKRQSHHEDAMQQAETEFKEELHKADVEHKQELKAQQLRAREVLATHESHALTTQNGLRHDLAQMQADRKDLEDLVTNLRQSIYAQQQGTEMKVLHEREKVQKTLKQLEIFRIRKETEHHARFVQYQQMCDELTDLRRRVGDESGARARLEEEMSTLKEEMASLKSQLTAATECKANLEQELTSLRRSREDEANMQHSLQVAREELQRLHENHCCLLDLQRLGASQLPEVDADTDSEGQAVQAPNDGDAQLQMLSTQDVENMQASVGFGNI